MFPTTQKLSLLMQEYTSHYSDKVSLGQEQPRIYLWIYKGENLALQCKWYFFLSDLQLDFCIIYFLSKIVDAF